MFYAYMMMSSRETQMMNGAHDSAIRPQVTGRPAKHIHAASHTMFHLLLLSYCMVLRHLATCEWQLSQHKLCIRRQYSALPAATAASQT